MSPNFNPLSGISAIMDHQKEFHPDMQFWGDKGTYTDKWCQWCNIQILKDGEPVSIEDQKEQALKMAQRME